MKYSITKSGPRLEALGAHHGYRVRISTLETVDSDCWPISVHVRGSESEPEVRIDVPKRPMRSAAEAIELGYECAVLWIEAEDHRGYA